MDSKRSHLLEAIVLRYLRHWTLVKIFVLEQSDTKVFLHEQKEAKWSHKKAPFAYQPPNLKEYLTKI
jgi:hypothetical protein